MGKKLIIANWKMNLSISEASLFIHRLAGFVERHNDVEIVLAPTALALQSVSLQTDRHQFKLAAQNFYWRDQGPYTGEISASQLRGLVQYALVGHSERRHVFNERDRDIKNKVQAAYRNGITPVLCVGETATDRALGEAGDVIHDQIIGGLNNITSGEAETLVIAYEPVWAVGTGNNAAPSEVAEVVKAIRRQVKHLFGAAVSKQVRVLYGGSVTLDNAQDYLDTEGIDGLLIGGTSLDAYAFAKLVNKAHEAKGNNS